MKISAHFGFFHPLYIFYITKEEGPLRFKIRIFNVILPSPAFSGRVGV